MPATTPAPERNFADTGYFAIPLQLFAAQLQPLPGMLYAWLCCEADAGHNPPQDMMIPALALGVSVPEIEAALDTLKARKMVVVKTATDWHLTNPEDWTASA